MAERQAAVPACPASLPEALRPRWDALAPVLAQMGTLRTVDAEALARYLMLEWEYAKTTKPVVDAITAQSVSDAERWIAIQDKLHKQLAELAGQFGLTPKSREARSLILPREA